MLASLATSVILEMHGDYRVELVFGVEMMFYGTAAALSPPVAGKWDYSSYHASFRNTIILVKGLIIINQQVGSMA